MSLVELKYGSSSVVNIDNSSTTIKLNITNTYINNNISIKANIPTYDDSVIIPEGPVHFTIDDNPIMETFIEIGEADVGRSINIISTLWSVMDVNTNVMINRQILHIALSHFQSRLQAAY